jgi:cell division septation protein DedD
VPVGTLFLSALAGGALVIALMIGLERDEPPTVSETDPLAELLAKNAASAATPPLVVDHDNVTFPKLLSDESERTTALAAVKDERGRLLEQLPAVSAQAPAELPSTDGFPKQVRPAGDLLSATSVTNDPKDELSQLASDRTREAPLEMAPPGMGGGYEIQVASFQDPADADAFVEELRRRGHSAFRQAAYVPERGLWHRVRIGPFKYKYKAQAYKDKLDKDERMSSFLVDPDKVKRQEDIKEAKRDARERKKQKSERLVIRPAE